MSDLTSSAETPLEERDLDAYLRHIGYNGPLRADLATHESLIGAHAATIPFENLEVLAGRVPSLDRASLRDKLLSGRRGGYCYEQNLWFLAALRTLGFDAHPAEARVRAKVPPDVITGRTHLAVRVVLGDRKLLADVGFGGMAPLAPVPFDGEPHRCADGAVYRLVARPDASDETALQIRTSDGWQDCYHVGPDAPHRVDLEMGNWFVATFPRSMLGNNLLVARAADGGRLTLFNHLLTFRRAATGTLEQCELSTRSEFKDVLGERFGLRLEPGDVDRLMDKLERVTRRA
jgi:N-hydroxyarylamine O-acetyltransferase